MPAQIYETQIQSAVELIRQRWKVAPKFAIILGTGAGQLANEIEVEHTIPYADIPGFPHSTALGHIGQWVCGRLAGKPVLAMQGRFHLYEGHSFAQTTLPIHVMHQLGVKVLFVSNASGGINPKFASGDIMLINSHIDLMFGRSSSATRLISDRRPSLRSDFYDQEMIEQALGCARTNDFAIQCGVYTGMLGPNYETRAEYRFLKKIGGDVAGMSTIPEVTVASQYRMRILGLSIITNVAKPDETVATSGQEVIAAAEAAAPKLTTIVTDAVSRIGTG